MVSMVSVEALRQEEQKIIQMKLLAAKKNEPRGLYVQEERWRHLQNKSEITCLNIKKCESKWDTQFDCIET